MPAIPAAGLTKWRTTGINLPKKIIFPIPYLSIQRCSVFSFLGLKYFESSRPNNLLPYLYPNQWPNCEPAIAKSGAPIASSRSER